MLDMKQKSNSVVTTVVDESANVMVFTVLGAGSTSLKLNEVSEANKKRAVFHGFKQRIVDAAAIARDKTTGLSASPEDKLAAMKTLCEHYMSGDENWNVRKSSGERIVGGLLVQAILAAYPGKNAEKVRETVKNWTKEERLKFQLRPEIAAEIVKIQQTLIGDEIDADELLASL